MPPELTAALALCRNLPSPPGIALRIIELAQDPEADIATAADIIAIDMALSARMLRIANSPLYASRRRIENLGQALTMLGLNATISLALGFTVTQGLTGGTGADHDLRQRAWKRSILSALAASQLGQARGLRRLEARHLFPVDLGRKRVEMLQHKPFGGAGWEAHARRDL